MSCFEELENKSGKEYVELANLIANKSKFNMDNLGEYVANFLTLFYGEKFTYIIGKFNVNEKTLIYKYVARRKDKVEYLNLQVLNKLYKAEDIAILDVTKSSKNRLTSIYTIEDNQLYENGKLTPIVKEFINSLIDININGNISYPKSYMDVSYNLLSKYYNIVKENYKLLYESKKEKLLNDLNNQFQEKFLELNRVLTKK